MDDQFGCTVLVSRKAESWGNVYDVVQRVRGSGQELAVDEGGVGADEGDEVGTVDRAQRFWAASMSLNVIASPASAALTATASAARPLAAHLKVGRGVTDRVL